MLRDLTKHVDRLRVRVPHGHFDHKPGAADSMAGRTVATIARALGKQGHIDAVVIVRDLDDRPERRAGLEQARDEARSWAAFPIVLGCANPKREAWVLCGFEPMAADEHERLAELRRELGFQANVEAHRLAAKDEQAKTNAKRVLYALTDGDWDREQRCWTEAPLELLKARGELTGLTAFLVEIETHLVPLLGPPR